MSKIKGSGFIKEIKKNKILVLMLLPTLLYFFIFCYIPMPGAYIAFVKYRIADGIFGSQFVGLQNFEFLVANGDLWRITKNTILYNVVFLVLGNVLQIAFAVMLSELGGRWFKKISQSIILFPNFISFVIVGIFAYNMFNYSTGSINSMLVSLGMERYEFYADPSIWKYIITAFYLWNSTGYGMIVYLAAITSLSTEIYEAAYIDGANTFQKIFYITLPQLRPTFMILLLFSLGGILRGQFDLFYNIIGDNSLLFPQTDIIDTYVYRGLIGNFNFSNSAAVGLYQSLFGLIIVVSVNAIVKKVNPEYALF